LEFKLNKIDTDIRKKMQEETKEDKVHSGKSINVNKDLKDEGSQCGNDNENSINKEIKKRYITIDGIKDNHENIDIKVEKVEKINESNSKGRILDTTK
jgi:predicted ribosome quality control (RQC) complex YloA/Tae2 family protein